MKHHLNGPLFCLTALFLGATALPQPAKSAPKQDKPAQPKPKPVAPKIADIFYDTEWEYQIATLYDKTKNIVSSVSGEAQFERNGKYHQDYYIGTIGNFYKGNYKLAGDVLTTYDEEGKKAFEFRVTAGTTPPVLVLSLFEADGTKSIDYSLIPKKK
ncbi:hypothetical protein EON83_16105 [bacterium]|nr:MAG: hypothetical protein EON83_16105 [bacterium]